MSCARPSRKPHRTVKMGWPTTGRGGTREGSAAARYAIRAGRGWLGDCPTARSSEWGLTDVSAHLPKEHEELGDGGR